MELHITQTKENLLLKRKEISGKLLFTGKTPSYAEVADALASKLSVGKEVIALQHVYTLFGKQEATFKVNVYTSSDILKHIEPKVKEKKTAAAAEKK